MRFKSELSAILAICGQTMTSCSGNSGSSSQAVDVTLVPLHEIVYEISRTDSASAIQFADSCIRNYDAETLALLTVAGYDSLSSEALMEFASSPAVKVFSPATDSLAPDYRFIADALSYTESAAVDEGLELGNHSYATVIWGKLQSVIFCDSVMLIGLNHYLGESYPGYDAMESYRRKAKEPVFLPYDLAEALVATAMPYQASENAATINRLVYEGALTEAKMRLVENADPALALGYSPEEYATLLENEKWIWDKMISSGIVFDHDPSAASRLVAPAPYCSLISTSCPGRAGRFIGYRIIRSYLDRHPDTKLSDILSTDFYNITNPLTVMAYRP